MHSYVVTHFDMFHIWIHRLSMNQCRLFQANAEFTLEKSREIHSKWNFAKLFRKKNCVHIVEIYFEILSKRLKSHGAQLNFIWKYCTSGTKIESTIHVWTYMYILSRVAQNGTCSCFMHMYRVVLSSKTKTCLEVIVFQCFVHLYH